MLRSDNELFDWPVSKWVAALRESIKIAGPADFDGIVISGNGPTLVPVDERGAAIDPALLWIDGRSEHLAGMPSFFLPKLAWMRTNRAGDFARTRTVLSTPEYLSFLLTGELHMVSPYAAFDKYIWDADQIAAYGFENIEFPQMIRPGSLAGRVSARAAADFGLRQGTPVYSAGTDFMMSLLGTGVMEPGMICDRAGTSEGINFCSPVELRTPNLRTLPHAKEGCFNIAGILSSTGRMFEWFRRFSGQQNKSYVAMIEAIEDLPDNASHPYFFPSDNHLESFEFTSASFVGLQPRHGAEEMGKAVLESIGFTINEVLRNLDKAGCRNGAFRVCGGQAKNGPWNQLKADILGLPVEVPEIADAELLGCAICGFMGMGQFDSLDVGSRQLVRIARVVEPRGEKVAVYREREAGYWALYQRLYRAQNPV